MSRLKRAIKDRSARIEAQQADLHTRIDRIYDELGEHASRPSWLLAAFGVGFLGGYRRGKRRQPEPEGEEEKRSGWLSEKFQQFAVPFILNLLQQYLTQPRAEAPADQTPPEQGEDAEEPSTP